MMTSEIERRTFFGALAGLLALPFVGQRIKRSPNAAELKKIAEQNPPPSEWYEGEPHTVTGTYSDSTSYTFVENCWRMPDWYIDLK